MRFAEKRSCSLAPAFLTDTERGLLAFVFLLRASASETLAEMVPAGVCTVMGSAPSTVQDMRRRVKHAADIFLRRVKLCCPFC